MVALRKESVDRNFHAVQIVIIVMVALRKESVDRNTLSPKSAPCEAPVALRKESVDRNSSGAKADTVSKVALRKESVDRNMYCKRKWQVTILSLSARRAWIEIPRTPSCF